jgi:hypothetical protein
MIIWVCLVLETSTVPISVHELEVLSPTLTTKLPKHTHCSKAETSLFLLHMFSRVLQQDFSYNIIFYWYKKVQNESCSDLILFIHVAFSLKTKCQDSKIYFWPAMLLCTITQKIIVFQSLVRSVIFICKQNRLNSKKALLYRKMFSVNHYSSSL